MRYQHPQPFRDVEHTADVGVEVEGDSAGEALARLVLAQASLLGGGARIDAEREERLAVPAGEPVAMAVAVLRELLFRFATERVLPAACEIVSFDPDRGAELVLDLGRFDPERHAEGLDLKAVTRHEARFERHQDRWRARIIFDI